MNTSPFTRNALFRQLLVGKNCFIEGMAQVQSKLKSEGRLILCRY
jgi:hypothetical protein